MKQILFLAFFLFFFAGVFGVVTNETRLLELGIDTLTIEGQNQEQCKEVSFLKPSGLTYLDYPVLSIHADFLPIASEDSTVKVLLDKEQIAFFKSNDFLNGFKRVEILQEQLKEKSLIEVCFKNSFSTTKTVFYNDSIIGFYQKPDFSKDYSFELEATPSRVRLFEQFKVKATLKNYGSEDVFVSLKYRKDSLEKETPETELIKGKTLLEANLVQCKERNLEGTCVLPGSVSFEYFLRPKVLGSITLLPAIAEFENQFGEKTGIVSNRPTILVIEPEINLKAFIKSEKDDFLTGTPEKFRIFLVNDGTTPLYNTTIKIQGEGLIIPDNQKTLFFEFIGEKQIIEREFEALSPSTGLFEIGCNVSYLDNEFEKSFCESRKLEFKDQAFDQKAIAGITLVFISVGLFIYIFYIKS